MLPGERGPVLVWRRGEALLAVEVDAVLEVAAITADGRAASREGPVPLLDLPGLPAGDEPTRAVVVRTRGGLAALPADSMEGIRAIAPERFSPTPEWLDALAADHLGGVVALDDDRLAALLVLDSLRPEP